MTTYQIRFEAAYRKLTFKHEGTSEDIARLEAFVLLLKQHLIAKDVLDLKAWETQPIQQRDSCLADFINLYGKQLWPGNLAARGHLAHPELKYSKKRGVKGGKSANRSFIASFDGRWTSKTSGWSGDKPKPNTADELAAMSKIGKELRKLIEILLEVPINKKRYWGLPSTDALCQKAIKVGDGSQEEGGFSPTTSELERELGIGLGPLVEEQEFGEFSDDDVVVEPADTSAGLE